MHRGPLREQRDRSTVVRTKYPALIRRRQGYGRQAAQGYRHAVPHEEILAKMNDSPMQQRRWKLPMVAAGLAVGSTIGFFIVGVRNEDARREVGFEFAFADTMPRLEIEAATLPAPGAWPAPAVPPAGQRWRFEVFTPPDIFHDPQSNQFTLVAAATMSMGAQESWSEPGSEEVAIEPDGPGWQLIGYHGRNGAWKGAFENLETGEIVVAGQGSRLEPRGLEVLRFEIPRRGTGAGEEMVPLEPKATAVVRDPATGHELALVAGGEVVTRTPVATSATEEDDGVAPEPVPPAATIQFNRR